MSSPRLLLVIPSATSFRLFLWELATAWSRDCGPVAVATGSELTPAESEPWPTGVERLPIPDLRAGSPWQVVQAAKAIQRHVKNWQPSIVHAHFTAAVVATALLKLPPKITRVCTFHGLHLAADRGSGTLSAKAAEVFSLCRMDHSWVLTSDDEDFLRQYGFGKNVGRLNSCGVGCDLERFSRHRFTDIDKDRLRASLGIQPSDDVLAFVGRRTAFKGFDLAVRAYQLIRKARPHARLLLIGAEDPLHSSGLTAVELNLLQGDRGIVDLGWQYDVSAYLSISDLMLFPSCREGMPVNLMESLAMGVPVVARNVRGCKDIVDEQTGVLVRGGSSVTLAQAALRLLDDRRLRDRMVTNAIASRHRFDRQRYVREQILAYGHLLDSQT